jgi:hypothetical protein
MLSPIRTAIAMTPGSLLVVGGFLVEGPDIGDFRGVVNP